MSDTDVRTSSECLLVSTTQLTSVTEAVLGHDLRTLRSFAPVVARGVGVLEDALAAGQVCRQMHLHLLDSQTCGSHVG